MPSSRSNLVSGRGGRHTVGASSPDVFVPTSEAWSTVLLYIPIVEEHTSYGRKRPPPPQTPRPMNWGKCQYRESEARRVEEYGDKRDGYTRVQGFRIDGRLNQAGIG